jgi:hypothetical protein
VIRSCARHFPELMSGLTSLLRIPISARSRNRTSPRFEHSTLSAAPLWRGHNRKDVGASPSLAVLPPPSAGDSTTAPRDSLERDRESGWFAPVATCRARPNARLPGIECWAGSHRHRDEIHQCRHCGIPARGIDPSSRARYQSTDVSRQGTLARPVWLCLRAVKVISGRASTAGHRAPSRTDVLAPISGLRR